MGDIFIAFLKSLLYTLVLGTVLYFVGEALPRKPFHADKFPFRPYRWEKEGKLYEKTKIKKWKDRVPDMSKIRKKMVPKRIGIAPKAAQVYRLVQETCVAEFIHILLIFCGFPMLFFWREALWLGWILTLGYALGNLVFVIIQRYNRPMLLSLAKRLERREERQHHAPDDLPEDPDSLG